MTYQPKVSVIIPVYGIERFIERCAESLFSQTIDDVEFIFIDDATPDNSIELIRYVLQRFPNRKKQTIILKHETNKGLPEARNTGMSVARGEYFLHFDGDDFADSDMLESMYKKAKDEDSDIVWCDWILSFENSERYMRQPYFDTPLNALKGMLGGSMKYNVWNKLIKQQIFTENRITFPSGHSMGEDMTILLAFAFAKKISYLNKAFYHYVKLNTNAISKSYSAKAIDDLTFNINRVETQLHQLYGNELDDEIAFLKLNAKFPLLIINGKSDTFRMWQNLFPESNKYIQKNHYVSARSRLIQSFASKNLFSLVRLHYYFVCKLVYGIIYK